MKDNMFVMTMYCGAFAITLYKMADGKLVEEKLNAIREDARRMEDDLK
jgi:hypothetical protein